MSMSMAEEDSEGAPVYGYARPVYGYGPGYAGFAYPSPARHTHASHASNANNQHARNVFARAVNQHANANAARNSFANRWNQLKNRRANQAVRARADRVAAKQQANAAKARVHVARYNRNRNTDVFSKKASDITNNFVHSAATAKNNAKATLVKNAAAHAGHAHKAANAAANANRAAANSAKNAAHSSASKSAAINSAAANNANQYNNYGSANGGYGSVGVYAPGRIGYGYYAPAYGYGRRYGGYGEYAPVYGKEY